MTKAFGKAILFGEHAVVYGIPAIAVGLQHGASARATTFTGQSVIVLEGQEYAAAEDTDLARAFRALLNELDATSVRAEVDIEVPAGCGLGASAAIAVALARAVASLKEPAPSDEKILAAANAWEGVFHGTPSGIDTAAAARGGCLWFTRADGASVLEVACAFHLAVAIAGPPASTRAMVDNVAHLKKRRPELVQKSLDAIESLVRNARHCLSAGDLTGLGKLMDLNQMLLSGLFVSTEAIERACNVARDAGALGAKLTGSGGGGAVIALSQGPPQAIVEAWQAHGFSGFASAVPATRGQETPA